jgi:hypothetical protein
MTLMVAASVKVCLCEQTGLPLAQTTFTAHMQGSRNPACSDAIHVSRMLRHCCYSPYPHLPPVDRINRLSRWTRSLACSVKLRTSSSLLQQGKTTVQVSLDHP